MLICKPSYYDTFRCIAGSCPDSCCKEWEVQVDPASAGYYRSLPGPLGDRLRQVLRDTEDDTVMTIENGRCPMWRQDGLCRIQAELGEDALCQVCRDFPRLRHDYGDFQELGLELSCPEAARLIFDCPDAEMLHLNVPGGEAAEYDTEAMDILLQSRVHALSLLRDTSRPIRERIALLLLYGYHAQEWLDSGDAADFDPNSAAESVLEFLQPGDMEEIAEFFRGLEILNPQWEQRLTAVQSPTFTPDCITLLRYLIQRYWLQAVSDYDLICRVKFMVISCLLIDGLGGSFPETAQQFSKEIENNLDNVEAILDAAYSHPAFTDAKLLGMLLPEKSFTDRS